MSAVESEARLARADTVLSLERGLSVITAFAATRRTMTISELAKETGLSKPSARRFLLTLQKIGYIRATERGFRLTPKVLELGHAYLSAAELPEMVEPVLDRLNEDLREACSVGILEGDLVFYIARSVTRRLMTISVRVGSPIDPGSTALGRILLAHAGDATVEGYLARHPLQAHTPFTVTDVAEFHRLLAQARSQGWTLSDQETEVGVRTIAVPIRGPQGSVIAGANVAAHASRITKRQLVREFLPRLQGAAAEMEGVISRFGHPSDLV